MNLLLLSCLIIVQGSKYGTSEQLKARINASNGEPVPPGYHSYFVVFKKKPNFDKKYESEGKKDFSIRGSYFCSGTILSRRWVLTTAKPIAHYPIGSYWMVSQSSVPAISDQELLNRHEIDFVLIHPKYDPDEDKDDLALARTSRALEFTFETRNVNMGLHNEPIVYTNCKLVVWSWYESTNVNMNRSEVSYQTNATHCSEHVLEFEEYFICLSNSELKRKHCDVNVGAPVICESVLVGVYRAETGACETDDYSNGHKAIRIDRRITQSWIEYGISPSLEPEGLEISGVTQKVCKLNI